MARVHAEGEVLDEAYSEVGTRMTARLPRDVAGDLSDYLAEAPS